MEPAPFSSSRPINWAFIVLALVLLLATLSTWFVNQLVVQQQRTRFVREVDTATLAVEQRIEAYVEVMRIARGLWSVGSGVSRDDFARFVDVLELPRQYPGIQGLGYAEYLRARELAAFERRQRAQRLPDFRVWPPGTREAYVPVTYLEPRDDANQFALGFDMFSEPRRRAALRAAVARGDAAATAPLTLVQERRLGSKQQGFLIYMPIFRGGQSLLTEPDRQAALQGFIYAPFRVGDFLTGVNTRSRYGQIELRVQDAGQTLFGQVLSEPAFFESRSFDIAGRNWTLQFSAPAEFGRDYVAFTPWLILLLGAGIAGAAFWATQIQVTARERAEEMTLRLARSRSSLDKSRAEFEAIFRAMHDTAVFADASGEVRQSNDALARTFGYTPDELRGRSLASLRADGTPGAPGFSESTATYRRKDGSEFVGEAQRSFVRGEGGEVIGQLEVVRDLTERLAADHALRESELRYRGVLEAMPQMVWIADPGGRQIYFNSGWYDYTGQSAAQVREEGFARALHPDDLERAQARWERAWRYGEAYEIEYRFRRHDGVYHWFVGRASPIRSASGEIIEWVGTCTDIHDRIEFEGQIRRSEARYRGLIEGMPQIVWLSGPRGEATYFNRRWAEYVGAARASQGLGALLHPEDLAGFEAGWGAALAGGHAFEGEFRLRREDGAYRTFVARALPVGGDEGEVIEWVGTLTDIEHQVYAEASSRLLAEVSRLLAAPLGEVREVTGVLRLLTERFVLGAALWLSDGNELLDAYEVRPGLDPASLPPRPVVEARVRQAITGREASLSLLESPPLSQTPCALAVVPVSARGEAPLGALALAYLTPVSEADLALAQEVAARLAIAIDNQRLFVQAREAEREVKELNLTLEARVEARTQELLEANRELEAFSYSVSHDLRTPLRHIVGFGDLLRKEMESELGDKGQRYLKIMTDAATRMSVLIDDLLSFSRMGRQELRIVPVDLNVLVQEARGEVSGEAQPERVEWDVPELPSVPADASLLRLVFVNLFSNALKYSRTRERSRVEVRARTTEDEVVVSVHDNGVGFDSRFADKLFGVFQRLHRAEEFEGTGIGLANVRRIVARHGGRVWAESTLGEGATFYVALPLKSHAELLQRQA